MDEFLSTAARARGDEDVIISSVIVTDATRRRVAVINCNVALFRRHRGRREVMRLSRG